MCVACVARQGSLSLGKKQRQLASLGGTSKPRVLIKRARTLSFRKQHFGSSKCGSTMPRLA